MARYGVYLTGRGDLRLELAPHGLRKTRSKVMMQNAVRNRSRTLSGVRGYCWRGALALDEGRVGVLGTCLSESDPSCSDFEDHAAVDDDLENVPCR